jgi:FkbM family methyltransferase
MFELNSYYKQKIPAVKKILPPMVDHPEACRRFPMLYDVIDFDSIKTILDIGARFCEQTIEMSYMFPDVQLYAFEPVPGSYQICVNNINSVDPVFRDRIKVFELAVSNKTERISFYEVDDTGSEHNVGASSKYQFVEGLNGTFFNKTWNQRRIEVQAVSLDDWRRDNNIGPVDLLWVDAQGSELDVYRGAEQTLKDVRVIITEVGIGSYYQGQSLKPEIDAYLISQGFKELEGAWEQSFQYEGNTIYVKK